MTPTLILANVMAALGVALFLAGAVGLVLGRTRPGITAGLIGLIFVGAGVAGSYLLHQSSAAQTAADTPSLSDSTLEFLSKD